MEESTESNTAQAETSRNPKELSTDVKRATDKAFVAAEQELERLESEKQQLIAERETKIAEIEVKKKSVIENLCKVLESSGVPKDKIASLVVKYFSGRDFISKSWLYECMAGYVNKERSEAIKEGKNLGKEKEQESMSATDNSTNAERIEVAAGVGGHSHTSTGSGGSGDSGGTIPSGPLGSRNVDTSADYASLRSVLNEMITRKEQTANGVFISNKLWEKFETVYSRTELLAAT
jgi:hypothetical protein